MPKKHSTSRKKAQKSNSANGSLTFIKEAAVSDISKYLVKQPVCDEECAGTKVSVPCPDDAALPCSTFLFSICKIQDCFHTDKDVCKSNKSSKCSVSAVDLTAKSVENDIGMKKKVKKPLLSVRNSQITDFFPVRRSNRQTSVCKMTERNRVIKDAILSGKEEGFEVVEYPDKGRGVITTRSLKRGEFVLEYFGELIGYEEAKRREGIYADKENIGCYMYYFKCKNKQYCIDATKETDRLGRLVNHSKKGNLRTRTFLIEDLPHLILFANKDIEAGEELSYDYGDRRKAAVESHPWLAS